MLKLKGEYAEFRLNKCAIYTHDGDNFLNIKFVDIFLKCIKLF
jgi:hypothetical protein